MNVLLTSLDTITITIFTLAYETDMMTKMGNAYSHSIHGIKIEMFTDKDSTVLLYAGETHFHKFASGGEP